MLENAPAEIQITEEFRSALALIHSGASPIFITGNAGTGKSTLLVHLRETSEKNIVVVAPTDMAAINVRGVTIHSFFKFPPKLLQAGDIKPNRERMELFRKLDILVIDEISMVRADLLDAIDISLQLHRADGRPCQGSPAPGPGRWSQRQQAGEAILFRTTFASEFEWLLFSENIEMRVDADGLTFYRNTLPPPSSIAFVEGP